MYNVDEFLQVISIGLIVTGFLLNTNRFLKSIELCKECLFILKERAGIKDEKLAKSFSVRIYFTMWKACRLISDDTNAIEYAKTVVNLFSELGEMYFHEGKYQQAEILSKKALLISKEIGYRGGEACSYTNLGVVDESVGEYEKAKEHHEKSLAIQKEIGNRNGEATSFMNLGNVYQSVGEYEKAKEHLEKSLVIQREIGDRRGEASCYINLATVYSSLGEFEKDKVYLEKSLAIQKEIGDRRGEATCYINLGGLYNSLDEYEKAKEHLEKSLAINKEIGDRIVEAFCYSNLGAVYGSFGEYEKAKEHLEKSLAIQKEIGNRSGEAHCYANLGKRYSSVGEYEKAKELLEKSLAIKKEIGERRGEAYCCSLLGDVYRSVGEYEKAKEHLEKSLAIKKEIGVRKGEASSYMDLGAIYSSVGEYEKAKKLLEKSLAMQKEIGARSEEAFCWRQLGHVYKSVGEHEKALEYQQKSLGIEIGLGNRHAVAHSLLVLGGEFFSRRMYHKANECNKEALAIYTDIGNREGVASAYANQGAVEQAVGNLIKAKEYYEKALAMSKNIGDRELEANIYLNFGHFLSKQSDHDRTEEYIKKALALSEKTGVVRTQLYSLITLAELRKRQEKKQEAIHYFRSAIEKCELMRGSLFDNDQLKISISDHNIFCYRNLIMLLCETGDPTDALFVSELSKARALADLMSAQYSLENPREWADLEGIMGKVCNRTCLYLSYYSGTIHLWILNATGTTHFCEVNGDDLLAQEGLKKDLETFLDFRMFGILPEEICNDQSKTCKEDRHKGWRIGGESEANQGPQMNLLICFKLIISPVVKFFEGPEIVIVPDRALYKIPFAALTDDNGKYLSETFRIRIAPSLTTLKLINESPADYHCQKGALIVGNPDVGEVIFKGKLTNITRLQYAEKEARMVAKRLGVEPLIGQQATKQAVLQAMNSVALIHIAAHGDAERGAIALAPSFRIPNGISKERLYLLTMSDISEIQLRAKLVVLSCCHSARGQTKAEGAVGIARAFLGSGARSVLVSLWALHDKATEQLMTHFYDHLVAGESAGKSLHEAMKWMRSKGYDVSQWAPFILIGDDVTIDFGEKGKIQ